MLVRNFVSFGAARVALLAIVVAAFTSCATKQEVALVNDPAVSGRESTLPWNQQEKWEGQGQFGGMAERFNQGSGGRR